LRPSSKKYYVPMPDAIRHRDLLHRLQSFETLTDAGVYVLARPTGDQDHNAWQSAANIEAATAAPPTAATCLCSIYRRCACWISGFP
jgi:hypothetical protein